MNDGKNEQLSDDIPSHSGMYSFFFLILEEWRACRQESKQVHRLVYFCFCGFSGISGLFTGASQAGWGDGHIECLLGTYQRRLFSIQIGSILNVHHLLVSLLYL